MIKKLIITGSAIAVILPIFFHIRNVSWVNSLSADEAESLLINIFPIFGLLAFTLLWLHCMCGVFWKYLCHHFSLETMEAFVRWSALVIFFSIILHPLFLLFYTKFNILALFGPGEHQLAMFLGLFGFLLLLTYDLGKLFKNNKFISRNWRNILIVSNIGFLLIFFHSLQIGSDLQTGWMRGLWIFYGVTAILAIIYTYGFRRDQSPSTCPP